MTSEPLTLFSLDEEPPRRRPVRRRDSMRPRPQGELQAQTQPTAETSTASGDVQRSSDDIGASTWGLTEKLLLTTTEAAQALGIGRSKLYELIRTGAVESVLIGSCRRVPAVSVMTYVEALRTATGRHD